jgi:bacterioferritin-associated ferredoxin
MSKKKNLINPIICVCNNVKKNEIEEAITKGCRTLPLIYDRTSAGVGPCGGSCRPTLIKILNHFLQTGKFLENPLKK